MDIVCFFVGKRKSIAERVWEGSGWNGQHALETLKDKCLVELEGIKNDELRMHDHLRDLGREMAPEFGPPHRLWRPADLKYLFVPSDYILVIGKAVDGAESTLNEYLFSDADLGIQAVTEIGTHKTALKEMSAIGCTVIIVDSCTLVEDINKSLHIAPLIMAAQLNCVRENG
ncbi:hypothetical protein SUGI_0666510 [Cryptomeria japonica]|nr:hypothetical protein SUGI_0666510 [Cryptomeria japonica]